MSDNTLTLIPTDPYFVPTDEAIRGARAALAALVPRAGQIIARVTPAPTFVGAGANFQSVSCNECGSEISPTAWTSAMQVAAQTDFADLTTLAPCCGARVSLNDLVYDWPQGFARFALEVMNPGVESVDASRIAQVVGHPLRLVWAHV